MLAKTMTARHVSHTRTEVIIDTSICQNTALPGDDYQTINVRSSVFCSESDDMLILLSWELQFVNTMLAVYSGGLQLGRIHRSLRCTPAMTAEVTGHVC